MKPFKQELFDTDPLADFEMDWAEPDLDERGPDVTALRAALYHKRPQTVVVVGCGKGRSVIEIAKICQDHDCDPELICVDTWLGQPEDYTATKGKTGLRAARLRLVSGFPMLYYGFARNVLDAGLSQSVTPLPQSPENAAKILRSYGVRPDLVYMDSATDTQPLYRDLMFFWPLMAKEGQIVGRDCSKSTVQAALDKFKDRTGVTPEREGNSYTISNA